MQAKEVQTTLTDMLSSFPVVVRTGKGYVEACLREVNKGAMATCFVHLCGAPAPLDFVFCAGDDSTDELMFASLHGAYGKDCEALRLFTTTVGRKPSEAKAYVGDHTDVVQLLESFAQGARRAVESHPHTVCTPCRRTAVDEVRRHFTGVDPSGFVRTCTNQLRRTRARERRGRQQR